MRDHQLKSEIWGGVDSSPFHLWTMQGRAQLWWCGFGFLHVCLSLSESLFYIRFNSLCDLDWNVAAQVPTNLKEVFLNFQL